jgi:ubiquinone/menaquinone biosynthesis C-methylase UbiE
MTETVQYIKVNDFGSTYHRLRQKEGRVYSDEEVAGLPDISATHQHYKEWQMRKFSCSKLAKHLSNYTRPLNILEVGCGNGWLSSKLAVIPNSHITGIDVNTEELLQAQRVFQNNTNLEFYKRSLQDGLLPGKRFDIIMFAASIQYFSSLKDVLQTTSGFLKSAGEIHILDSHFYKQSELASAKQRTDTYYHSIGFPEMSDHYFHHSFDELNSFDYTILYNPAAFTLFLSKSKNPFPWICIKQK